MSFRAVEGGAVGGDDSAVCPEAGAVRAEAPFERMAVTLPEGRASVLVGGSAGGSVLVFCHATGFNALTYRALLAPLTQRIRIIVPDLRGHGLSELPADPKRLRSWQTYACDLAALIEAMNLSRVTLAGHSMGAVTALLAAARLGEHVKSLVLLDPVILPRPYYWMQAMPGPGHLRARVHPMVAQAARRRAVFPSREEMASAYRGRGAFARWSDEVLWDYIRGGTKDLPDGTVTLACAPAWEAATFAGQAHFPWAAITRLDMPVTLVAAGERSTCPPRVAGAIKRLKPRWAVQRLEDTRHLFPMEEPELARAPLMRALEAA